jgi:hypothetical protein
VETEKKLLNKVLHYWCSLLHFTGFDQMKEMRWANRVSCYGGRETQSFPCGRPKDEWEDNTVMDLEWNSKRERRLD